jgi:hypothetical protein
MGGFAARICVFAAAFVVFAAGKASAEIERVVVDGSGSLGTFGGRTYVWVTASMEGTVAREDGTIGHYRVPISLNYPESGSNGFGFVDVVTISDFTNFTAETAPRGERSVLYSGATIFSDFLNTEGYTYVSVQWSRTVTEILGPGYGVIENGTDGWEIIKDAARLLRDPLLEGLPGQPAPVEHVIGHGYSGIAQLLRGFVWRGENREDDGSLVFDGLFVAAHGGETCRILNNVDTPRSQPGRPVTPTFYAGQDCPEPLPEDGKIVLLRTQSEVEGDAALTRHELPGYRIYEVAGVSHVPVFMNNLRDLGAPRQNPVSWQPVAKALLRHLREWIATGREPPPSLYIDGAVGADGVFRLALDEDGNVLGGIRLPHMATLLPDGQRSGAPLGLYTGFDPDLDLPRYGYASSGGTFDPFSTEELARRYPTRETYVDLVRRAAEALLAGGYILEEDYAAYIRAAERRPW